MGAKHEPGELYALDLLSASIEVEDPRAVVLARRYHASAVGREAGVGECAGMARELQHDRAGLGVADVGDQALFQDDHAATIGGEVDRELLEGEGDGCNQGADRAPLARARLPEPHFISADRVYVAVAGGK